MAFNKLSKGKELVVIATLLSIFGTVTERQIRDLFGYLSDSAYGKIISRMRMEGLAYRSANALYIAQSKLAFERSSIDASVICFSAFCLMRDKIQDFCAGTYPTMVSVAADDSEYDIIPVLEHTVDAVNAALDDLPDRTVRYLVTRDLGIAQAIRLRHKNDYILQVDEKNEIKIYKPKGA